MSLRDKMLAVIGDVNAQVAEREELVEMIAIALLTHKNLFILGDPGQAKSYAINAFRSRITGAVQFERLLSKQTDEEQIFGRIDLASLIPGSVPEEVLKRDSRYQEMRRELEAAMDDQRNSMDDGSLRKRVEGLIAGLETYRKAMATLYPAVPTVNTSGKLPEAHICFLDEIFKCNDGVLNSLLTALNERKYTNEGRTYNIPTISFMAASNEIPNFNDPQEKILAALYDRLELKVVTANIADRGKRLSVLREKQSGGFGTVSATITLDELEDMQKEAAAISVPDAINELADDILCDLRKEVPVSDRKYLNYYPIAQAKAWLEGHAEVQSEDLLALKNYLWYKPADIPTVEATLTRMCVNPMQDKVNDLWWTAQGVSEELNESVNGGVEPRKAFRKFRTEMIRVYGLYSELAGKAQGDSEQKLVDKLLSDMEDLSRSAHEKFGFTPMPLKELAELN